MHDKEKNECWIIDVACPLDFRIKDKEKEKIDIYQDLKYEIKRLWKCRKVEVIPVVIGALGTVHSNLEAWLEKIESKEYFSILQKKCLLGTARILRYVLNT